MESLIGMEALINKTHTKGCLFIRGAYRNRGAKSDHYGSSTQILTPERLNKYLRHYYMSLPPPPPPQPLGLNNDDSYGIESDTKQKVK